MDVCSRWASGSGTLQTWISCSPHRALPGASGARARFREAPISSRSVDECSRPSRRRERRVVVKKESSLVSKLCAHHSKYKADRQPRCASCPHVVPKFRHFCTAGQTICGERVDKGLVSDHSRRLHLKQVTTLPPRVPSCISPMCFREVSFRVGFPIPFIAGEVSHFSDL
jgi:hypothetical protein